MHTLKHKKKVRQTLEWIHKTGEPSPFHTHCPSHTLCLAIPHKPGDRLLLLHIEKTLTSTFLLAIHCKIMHHVKWSHIISEYTWISASVDYRLSFAYMFKGRAKVYEADQGARLQRQECVWCATASHRPENRPATPSRNSASHALFTQPVPGPGNKAV